MGKSRTAQMQDCLWELHRQMPSIENCWVTTVDGLMRAMMVPAMIDDQTSVAYSGGAVMLSRAQELLAAYKIGRVEEIQLAYKDSSLIIIPIGEDAVLSVVHDLTSPPDLVSHTIKSVNSFLESLI